MRMENLSGLEGEVSVETRLERVRGVSGGIEDGVAGLDRVAIVALLPVA